MIFNIAKDFSKFPGGRYISDGPNSGEKLREWIHSALQFNEKELILELDGTCGLPPSFLEEAFGGLVREYLYNLSYLERKIKLISEDEDLINQIWEYMEDAEKCLW